MSNTRPTNTPPSTTVKADTTTSEARATGELVTPTPVITTIAPAPASANLPGMTAAADAKAAPKAPRKPTPTPAPEKRLALSPDVIAAANDRARIVTGSDNPEVIRRAREEILAAGQREPNTRTSRVAGGLRDRRESDRLEETRGKDPFANQRR